MVEIGKYPLVIIIPKTANRSLTGKKGRDIVVYQDPAFSKEMTLSIMNGIREFIYLKTLERAGDAMDKQGEAIDLLETHVDSLADKLESTAETLESLEAKLDRFARMHGRGRGKAREADTDEGDTDDFEKPDRVERVASAIGLKVKQKYLSGGGKRLKPSSVQQSVPGWTIFALFWIAQVFAINLISERESGAFRRVMISPVSFYAYILSKAIPFLVINIFQAVFLFLIGIYVLPALGCAKLELHNIPALAVLTVAVSIAAVSFGLTLAGFFKTPFAAASVASSILVVMTALAGIMVPKFIMPESMQQLTDFVPHGIALEGYLDVLLRGHTTLQILPKVGQLLLFATGFSLIGFWRTRKLQD